MRTKKITLFYRIFSDKILEPIAIEMKRKNDWVKNIQLSIDKRYRFKTVKVTYEIFDSDIERQRRFFHVCVKYFAIQNMDLFEGQPSSKVLNQYREEILDEMLGYDMILVSKTVRKRKSTTDLRTVQAWSNFLQTLEETIFDSNGYEFPDSKEFWDLVEEFGGKENGRQKAEKISIERLQNKIKNKCKTTT